MIAPGSDGQRSVQIREDQTEPGQRPELGSHAFGLGYRLEIAYPCDGRWLVTSWNEGDGRLVLAGAF